MQDAIKSERKMIHDILGAAQMLLTNVASFTCELAILGLFFVFLFAVIFYFTGFREKWGGRYIRDSIIGMILVSLVYVGLLGANGPPDISIFFMSLG